MRILICGGRDYKNKERVFEVLDWLVTADEGHHICHGGARGADTLAGLWAKSRKVKCTVFPADWSLGRSAGVLRNLQMLDEFRPQLVIAFPGGRGTFHMQTAARAAGVLIAAID